MGKISFTFSSAAAMLCAFCIPARRMNLPAQRGLRAKTDRLDAATIARVLLSGEARVGYVPDEQITSYRELVRLHTQSLVMI